MSGLRIDNALPPFNIRGGGSVLTRVTAGPTTLVPAAPAGYFNVFTGGRAMNENTTTSADVTFQDDDGLFKIFSTAAGTGIIARGAGTDPSLSASNSLNNMISRSAITCTVTAGGPVMVQGYWCLVPDAGIVTSVMSLTASYQSVPNIIPANANDLSGPWGAFGPFGWLPGSLLQQSMLCNNDTAAVALVHRHTRGAVVSTWTANTVANAKASSTLFASMGPFIQGDVFELKAVAAPNVAGSIIVRFFYMIVPKLAG